MGDNNAIHVPLLERTSMSDGADILEQNFPATVTEVKKKKKFKLPKWCRPFNCSADKMDAEDRLNLNWVQKWFQYGRFPWKFIFHALLTAACTAMVFMQTNDQTEYVVAMDATWYQLFFPPEFEYAGDYADNTYYFYNVNDTVDSVRHAVSQYLLFPNSSVVPFKFSPAKPGVAAQLEVNSYYDCGSVYDASNLRFDMSTNTTEYDISPHNLGPFKNISQEDLRAFFYCLQTMVLSFGYKSVHLQYDHPIEYHHTVQLIYDNSVQGGRISLDMGWTKTRLSDLSYSKLIQLYKAMLDVAIIFFAVMSQVLSWVSIGKSFQLFATARRKLSRRDLRSINSDGGGGGDPNSPYRLVNDISWNQLPLRTKLRFFNMWFVITILGNLANILAAFLDFFVAEDAETGAWERLLLGIGVLLAWINLIRYLEFDKKYTVLIIALQRGFPSAIRFLLGALPVFIGFALFGVSYFSETSARFSSFGTACVTLFGLQNGDDVQGTFSDTSSDLLVSRVYLAVFVFISIYGVANIFIAIMDESYSASMRQAEAELAKQRRESVRPSRESDLTNDDELWNAILGLSKPSNSKGPKRSRKKKDGGAGGSGSGGSGGGGGGDSGNGGGGVAINVPDAGSASTDVYDHDPPTDDTNIFSDDYDDVGEQLKMFMEAMEAQNAKFREEMRASLASFMADMKTPRRMTSPQPPVKSPSPPSTTTTTTTTPASNLQRSGSKKKISFDLSRTTSSPALGRHTTSPTSATTPSSAQLKSSLSAYATRHPPAGTEHDTTSTDNNNNNTTSTTSSSNNNNNVPEPDLFVEEHPSTTPPTATSLPSSIPTPTTQTSGTPTPLLDLLSTPPSPPSNISSASVSPRPTSPSTEGVPLIPFTSSPPNTTPTTSTPSTTSTSSTTSTTSTSSTTPPTSSTTPPTSSTTPPTSSTTPPTSSTTPPTTTPPNPSDGSTSEQR